MTSKQVMLIAVLVGVISGCESLNSKVDTWLTQKGAPPLDSPYPTRHIWAIAPLRNESGSSSADGLALADHLARQLENASNLDVLPVNRTLAAMEAIELGWVASPQQAKRLLETLGADGLVVGTITAYDPYDPPKLGLAIELYTNPAVEASDAAVLGSPSAESIEPGSADSLASLQRLAWSATAVSTQPDGGGATKQPVSVVSAFFDGASPKVRMGLEHYAHERGEPRVAESWHTYRISMDLYSEFVSYVMSWRLLRVEAQRISPLATTHSPTR